MLRVIVVTLDHGRNDVRADAPATLLRGLGNEVTTVGYDLAELPRSFGVPDIIIIEAGSHLEIGRNAIRRIREREDLANIRVLMCVDLARISVMDMEMGADDFIVMPLCAEELSARVQQLRWRDQTSLTTPRIRYGEITLDCTSLQAFVGDRSLKLTPYEFQLLRFLVDRAGRVFTRQELLSRVWGYRHVGRVRTVDTHVLNLRAKLGPLGIHLEAVRGMGYKLHRPQSGSGRAIETAV
ncbi:MAG TPA: response regulator transcription factor [Polyangia bacterium]|nr:response regulator transcription factor [Polyangia bacterium]